SWPHSFKAVTSCCLSENPAWSEPITIRTRRVYRRPSIPRGCPTRLVRFEPEERHDSGAPVRPMELDDTPRVTPSMLRRADDCCHRRLAHEHRGGKMWGNRVGDARFAVSNRLSADARLAHAEADVVRAEAFVDPRELAPEQRRVYDT